MRAIRVYASGKTEEIDSPFAAWANVTEHRSGEFVRNRFFCLSSLHAADEPSSRMPRGGLLVYIEQPEHRYRAWLAKRKVAT